MRESDITFVQVSVRFTSNLFLIGETETQKKYFKPEGIHLQKSQFKTFI